MDYFYQFLISSLSSYILEISSGLAGLYFLKKCPNTHKSNKYLVYFLWFTVFVEVVGVYAPFAYFTNYEYFAFVKDTVYKDNYWWYNMYFLISFSFFIYYFNSFLVSSKIKKGIKYLIVLYIISGTINLMISDIFFIGYLGLNDFVFIC